MTNDLSGLPAERGSGEIVQGEMTNLLELAIREKVPVETLERLTALQERILDRNAAADYAHAKNEFQHRCPMIRKTSIAQIATAGGASYSYAYAELPEIAETIRPILFDLGLSYTWDSKLDGATLTCTCTVRHVNGHAESASFSCPTASKAGMSEAQKCASALTYAKRQSLIQVLGLTTCDPDMDGADEKAVEPVTAEQAANLQALCEEVKADMGKFLAWLKAKSLVEIRASDYTRAVRELERKRNAPTKGAGK